MLGRGGGGGEREYTGVGGKLKFRIDRCIDKNKPLMLTVADAWSSDFLGSGV